MGVGVHMWCVYLYIDGIYACVVCIDGVCMVNVFCCIDGIFACACV